MPSHHPLYSSSCRSWMLLGIYEQNILLHGVVALAVNSLAIHSSGYALSSEPVSFPLERSFESCGVETAFGRPSISEPWPPFLSEKRPISTRLKSSR